MLPVLPPPWRSRGRQENGGSRVRLSGARIGGVSEPMRTCSGSPFEAIIGFSRAVQVGDRVLVSGTGPVWPDGTCPDDAGRQARRCFEIIAATLSESGASMADVVRTRMFITSTGDAEAIGAVHRAMFDQIRPASTMVVVAALLDPRWRVEIEAEAVTARR